MLISVALGQVLSLLICGIGLTSKYLTEDFHANTPVFQSFLNYILLFLVYTTTLAVRQGEENLLAILRRRWWKYMILGLIDLEANYLVVKAYQYTTLTSIQLLDCFVIPVVILLSWFFLLIRYKAVHFLGIVVCRVVGVSRSPETQKENAEVQARQVGCPRSQSQQSRDWSPRLPEQDSPPRCCCELKIEGKASETAPASDPQPYNSARPYLKSTLKTHPSAFLILFYATLVPRPISQCHTKEPVLRSICGVALEMDTLFGPTRGENKLVGDLLVLGGATLYGISNVWEEYIVRTLSRVEFLGMIGLFGAFFSGIQLAIMEHKELLKVPWDWQIGLLYVGFSACMFGLYSFMPVVIKKTSATSVNLSLLTADLYSLFCGLFLFHYKFSGLYLLSFFTILIGLVLYSSTSTYVAQDPRVYKQFRNPSGPAVDLPAAAQVEPSVTYTSLGQETEEEPHVRVA
ncbi:solute carrier family 35 member F1 [Carlito syrichta]|uniref:Solute carrier family 35 member F1 n=1 Tax=Carlito syrichta TaxID=1868482 RepID=A0A3Q0E5S6_CARSF|nr:solute carrier family 35 member F1 [Carlito syrichta]